MFLRSFTLDDRCASVFLRFLSVFSGLNMYFVLHYFVLDKCDRFVSYMFTKRTLQIATLLTTKLTNDQYSIPIIYRFQ